MVNRLALFDGELINLVFGHMLVADVHDNNIRALHHPSVAAGDGIQGEQRLDARIKNCIVAFRDKRAREIGLTNDGRNQKEYAVGVRFLVFGAVTAHEVIKMIDAAEIKVAGLIPNDLLQKLDDPIVVVDLLRVVRLSAKGDDHIVFPLKTKRCATEATHRKTQTPIAATQNLINGGGLLFHTTRWSLHFCKIHRVVCLKKGYSIPLYEASNAFSVYSVLCSKTIITQKNMNYKRLHKKCEKERNIRCVILSGARRKEFYF